MQKDQIRPLFYLCILSLLLWTGCSNEEVKKTINSGRVYTLYDSLDRIKRDYEGRNLSDFMAEYAPSYPDLQDEKKRTGEVFKRYTQIKLQFYLDHIVLDKASSSLFVRWEGEWIHPSEEPLKTEGNSILRFSGETAPHLIEIQGIDPFTAPIKEKRS